MKPEQAAQLLRDMDEAPIAELIERQAAENTALAGMVVVLLQTLDTIRTNRIGDTGGCDAEPVECDCSEHVAIKALALTLPEAAAQVGEWREKAAKWDDETTQAHLFWMLMKGSTNQALEYYRKARAAKEQG